MTGSDVDSPRAPRPVEYYAPPARVARIDVLKKAGRDRERGARTTVHFHAAELECALGPVAFGCYSLTPLEGP